MAGAPAAPWSVASQASRSVNTVAPPRAKFGTAAFEARLDRETNSRAVQGNTVTPLFDGKESFAERDKLIAGAKHSICLQTFIFDSDETGWALAKQLAAKAKEGVTVRVVYDSLGSNRADPKMFKLMRDAGVQLREYGPPWQVWDLNDRWHEKNLIVDGKASILGGMNIADEYRLGGTPMPVKNRKNTEGWRDVDVKLEGPIVRDSVHAFIRNWHLLGPPMTPQEEYKLFPPLVAKPEGPSVRVVQQNRSLPGRTDAAFKLYLRAIEAADKSINIESAYFVPPPDLRRALIEAAKRGVEVKILTNGRSATDFPIVADAARYFYDDLLAAGVQIHESSALTVHSKTATFDGKYSIIGSLNLNGRSKNLDTEIVMGTDDPSVAEKMGRRFTTGLARARAVSKLEMSGESLMTNLKQWTLSTIAWTI